MTPAAALASPYRARYPVFDKRAVGLEWDIRKGPEGFQESGLAASLADNRERLDALQDKLRLWTSQAPHAADDVGLCDDEVEVALLREKQRRASA